MEQKDHFKETTGAYLEIDGIGCSMTIETRPIYCDRGNYCAKFFSKDDRCRIDEQDGFPRYYFNLEYAKDECIAFLKKRELYIGNQFKINLAFIP